MINLEPVKDVLAECNDLVKSLHGADLDETDAVAGSTKGEARKIRAQLSQDLQFLASRLELAAQLVRVEYWYARGETDPLHPERSD